MYTLTRLRRLHSPVYVPANLIRSSLQGGSIDAWMNIDRVNVLHGHTGCVNALSWSTDGLILVSGGDDRTIRLWQLEAADLATPLPFKTCISFQTGHMANLFNAQFLSSSTDILATCAGDEEVRIFDLSKVAGIDSTVTDTQRRGSLTEIGCERVIHCHEGPVKRISTEGTNRHFLTVSEDGTVRQHDLRSSHKCFRSRSNCPPPLVKLPFDLSTLATSNLTPYYFVVAGESSHAYLYDRRYCDRNLLVEWGVPSGADGMTTCVRRLGRFQKDTRHRFGQDHVTGARMSQTHAHEVLLSYSADAVYLFNVQDEPATHIRPYPSAKDVERICEKRSGIDASSSQNSSTLTKGDDCEMDWDTRSDGQGVIEASTDDDGSEVEGSLRLPLVLPRSKYVGACNVETVKDVNFLGQSSEFVASGSDDGNFFVWKKDSGRLLNILEGDEHVVNVIEENPRFQVCAVSGIDHSVKIFSPCHLPSRFSKTSEMNDIMRSNAENSRRAFNQRERFIEFVARYREMSGLGDEDEGPEGRRVAQCAHQ